MKMPYAIVAVNISVWIMIMIFELISYGVIVGGDGCIADLVFFICYPNLEWWQFQCLLYDCVPWPAKFLHHARWYDCDCAGASWLELSILTSVLTREMQLLWLSLLFIRVQRSEKANWYCSFLSVESYHLRKYSENIYTSTVKAFRKCEHPHWETLTRRDASQLYAFLQILINIHCGR